MTCILGLDPGVSGAVAFIHTEAPDRVAVYDMPVADGEVDPHELARLIGIHAPRLAYVERVNAMPGGGTRKMGATSAFNFGGAYAAARTVVALSGTPMVPVTPGAWKKAAGLVGGPEGKEQARAMALRLFPECADSFRRKKDHGRAEAALIALHGMRQRAAETA